MPFNPMYTQQTDAAESPSMTVLQAVSNVSNIPLNELDPLYDVIDLEALNALLSSSSNCQISFQYNGFDVTVNGEEVLIDDNSHSPG